jgi:glutamyl-tRNA synthetase
MNKKPIRTRIAPSPTGVMHIGTARTALFNYLFAKQNNGKFIVRIEDTDKDRSKPEFEKSIMDGLEVLGLQYDEFYRQSDRSEIYAEFLNKLIAEDKVYVSKETEGDRESVIRFRNPCKKITFKDLIRGEITFDTTELGDFVIAKSPTEPLYHFAVVLDDFLMDITHIIRGEDGISNTPRQILLQEALSAPTPEYAHLPLILGKDKSKLSKRHGAVSLTAFQEQGYTTEAIINQLAFLGWNPGTEKEIYSMDELITDFSIEKVQKGGAVFNEEKLQWFNHAYLQNMSDEEFLKNVRARLSVFNPTDEQILKLKNIILERINIFTDVENMVSAGELDYYFKAPENYPIENIIWKKSDKEKTIANLKNTHQILTDAFKDQEAKITSPESIKEALWSYAETNGKGDVLWPLRYCLSGVDRSPDPFNLIFILGLNESLVRIETALQKLN